MRETRTHIALELVEESDVVVGQALDEDASNGGLVVGEGAPEDSGAVLRPNDGRIVCREAYVSIARGETVRERERDGPSPSTWRRAWSTRRASLVVRCSPGLPMTRARTAAWQRVP